VGNSHTVELERLGATLRAHDHERFEDVRGAMYPAALRGEPIVAEATPSDRGHARQAWESRVTPEGAALQNDWPYIGILEMGSRPHWPPIMPILRWLVRKEGLDLAGGSRSFNDLSEVPSQTYAVARAIQATIAREGTKPHHMVQNNLPKLRSIAKDEVEKVLRRGGPSGSGGGSIPF